MKVAKLNSQIKKFIKDYKNSQRPALLVGGGVRTSGAIKELQKLGRLMNVPVFPTWNALDIVTRIILIIVEELNPMEVLEEILHSKFRPVDDYWLQTIRKNYWRKCSILC